MCMWIHFCKNYPQKTYLSIYLSISARDRQHAQRSRRAGCIVVSKTLKGLVTRSSVVRGRGSVQSSTEMRLAQSGDPCVRDDRIGSCIKIYDCSEVILAIRENRPPPKACHTSPTDPVPFVCCLDKAGSPTPKPVTTTPIASVTSRTSQVNERLARKSEHSQF